MENRVATGVAVLAQLAFGIGGCNEVTDGQGETVQLEVSVRVGNGGESPVPGVALCEANPGTHMETENCTTTDSDGRAVLALPEDREVSWTLTKDGHGKILVADVTDATIRRNLAILMATDGWLDSAATDVGTGYPPVGEGVIILITPRQGLTFHLVTGTGRVYYNDENRQPRPELEETTSSGFGGFVEVGPGNVEIEIQGMTEECSVDLGWPGSANNRIRVPVREGYYTYTAITCE
jgi:hypothetical protein